MNIDIRIDGIRNQILNLEDSTSINNIIKEAAIDDLNILCYKINHTIYVNDDYMISNDTLLNCLTLKHPEGYRIYQDSAIYILAKAFYNIFGRDHHLVIEHAIGDGVYCEVFQTDPLSETDCARIKQEMQMIINNNIPIENLEVSYNEAEDIFGAMGRTDVIKNLQYYYRRTINVQRCGKFYDCFNRHLVASTGKVELFDIIYQAPGFILRFPSPIDRLMSPHFVLFKKLFKTHQEHDKWLSILKVHNIIDINKLNDEYDISQFILVEEALHEKKIAEIAANIVNNPEVKIVLIAGPSSSGKTTFAKRLSVQLQACKATPLVIGLDDYFLSRDKTPRKENGDYDFESIYSLDIEYLNKQLIALLKGETIELPTYNFSRGIRQRSNNYITLKKDNIIVMEGIHGLNELLTEAIPAANKVKIYVSALNQLNIDNHNRIATTDCRLIRRIVRDHQYRGYSAEETLLRWRDVRDGEEKNIFPYQENADYMFNSSLTYELGVLKKHVWKLLKKVNKNSSAYGEATRLIYLLNHFNDIPDSLVPYNSIIREFTNGSVFRY